MDESRAEKIRIGLEEGQKRAKTIWMLVHYFSTIFWLEESDLACKTLNPISKSFNFFGETPTRAYLATYSLALLRGLNMTFPQLDPSHAAKSI